MTPAEISAALARLVPDAIALLENTVRQKQSRPPSRAVLDAAWKLIDRGLSMEPVAEAVPSEVTELANVLELVTGG